MLLLLLLLLLFGGEGQGEMKDKPRIGCSPVSGREEWAWVGSGLTVGRHQIGRNEGGKKKKGVNEPKGGGKGGTGGGGGFDVKVSWRDLVFFAPIVYRAAATDGSIDGMGSRCN